MKEGEKEGTGVEDLLPGLPPGWTWERWHREVREKVRDLEAVTKDRLRRPRKRDLGVREAKRLYRDARDKLAKLLAMAGGGDGGNGDEPAG
jgi:hypothetical protein